VLLRVLPYGDVSVGYYLNRDGIVNKLALPRYVITSLQRDAGSGSNELPPVSASSSGECRCESRPRREHERELSAARMLTRFQGTLAHETACPAGMIRSRTASLDTAPEGYENAHLDDHAAATT
jgi:hypothetical protein